jgi:hypothetical protein
MASMMAWNLTYNVVLEVILECLQRRHDEINWAFCIERIALGAPTLEALNVFTSQLKDLILEREAYHRKKRRHSIGCLLWNTRSSLSVAISI